MSTNRSVTHLFATFLMVIAILLIMNLIVSPESMAEWTIVAALVTFVGAVVLWTWIWWEDRPRAEVEDTDMIAIPQVREFVIDRPAPRVAATTNNAGETATVVGKEEPAAGVVSPVSKATMEDQGHKGKVEPAIQDPLHPDLSPKTLRHQEEVEKQAAEFEAEQEQIRAHPGGENYQQDQATTASDVPPELATTTDPQQGREVHVSPPPAEPDLDRENVANEAAAAPMGESQTVHDAQTGDPVAEKRVGEASAAKEVKPLSETEAESIVKQVTDEKKVNEAEVEDTATKLTNAYVDPFEQIEGIGPVYRDILINAGITTFKQLSEMSHEQINEMLQKADVKRIPRSTETWAEQAGYLARDDREGLSTFRATLDSGRRRSGGDD